LFSARAAFEDGSASSYPGRALTVAVEFVTAGNVASFLAMVGKLYDLARYHGHLDIGVAVDGLSGGASMTIMDRLMHGTTYDAGEFRRDTRIAAVELHDPRSVVSRLFRPPL
jgi:hypothetical protein